VDRLQRQMQPVFELSPSIRGFARGGLPELNIGLAPSSIEIYAFAPGLDRSKIELHVERGVLSLAGERASDLPDRDSKSSVHVNERFAGRLHRVITLSDDLDPNKVQANYRDGILHVSIQRRESAQPRRINIT
jgi:HSP20 family protein